MVGVEQGCCAATIPPARPSPAAPPASCRSHPDVPSMPKVVMQYNVVAGAWRQLGHTGASEQGGGGGGAGTCHVCAAVHGSRNWGPTVCAGMGRGVRRRQHLAAQRCKAPSPRRHPPAPSSMRAGGVAGIEIKASGGNAYETSTLQARGGGACRAAGWLACPLALPREDATNTACATQLMIYRLAAATPTHHSTTHHTHPPAPNAGRCSEVSEQQLAGGRVLHPGHRHPRLP